VAHSPDSHAVLESAVQAAAVDRGAVRQLEEQLGANELARLVAAFLEGVPARLAGLRQAVAAGNAERARDEADALKRAARSFGAAELSELAVRLERESATGSLVGAEEVVDDLRAALARTRAELEEQLGVEHTELARSLRALVARDRA
jgi:HPt (histidine-containing phosphotransfer) domain-containing protein